MSVKLHSSGTVVLCCFVKLSIISAIIFTVHRHSGHEKMLLKVWLSQWMSMGRIYGWSQNLNTGEITYTLLISTMDTATAGVAIPKGENPVDSFLKVLKRMILIWSTLFVKEFDYHLSTIYSSCHSSHTESVSTACASLHICSFRYFLFSFSYLLAAIGSRFFALVILRDFCCFITIFTARSEIVLRIPVYQSEVLYYFINIGFCCHYCRLLFTVPVQILFIVEFY